MNKILKRIWLPALGIITGAIAGFIYWKLVGCNSGTCAITSKPLNSMLYFGLVGMLLFSIFQKKEKVR